VLVIKAGIQAYICAIENYSPRENSNSSREKEKHVVVVSSPVRNITPPVTGARKTGGYSSWR
jgi:hypothetical protein